MTLTQDKIDLISRIIKSDRKYSSNEDLYDDFFNETCRRSNTIINAIDNENTLESYVRRVASTAITNVLKDNGRLRRSKNGYTSTKEVVFEPSKTGEVIDYSGYKVNYEGIKLPPTPEEIAIQKEVLEFVAQTVKKIDAEDSDKNYLNIYSMRYDKGMTQKEISEELGISQSEISKRLYCLLDKVKNVLN